MVTYKSDSAVVRFFCCFSSSNCCTDFATSISTYAWCGHCFHSSSRFSNCNSGSGRPRITPRNSNSWFCSGLAKRLSFVMEMTARFGCTTCYWRAQSSTHRFLAWRSISCFIYMKCVEMWLEFSVLYNTCTFNMSEGWERVKRSLTGHQNLTTEIMDLERQILSTFSRTLPDIEGSDLLKSLQEGLNNLNPLGHVSTLIGTTFGNTVFISLLCCVAFLVFRRWRKGKQLKHKAEKIQTMLQFIKANKKGEMKG